MFTLNQGDFRQLVQATGCLVSWRQDLPLRPSLICRSTTLTSALNRSSVARPASPRAVNRLSIARPDSLNSVNSRSCISAIANSARIPSSVRPQRSSALTYRSSALAYRTSNCASCSIIKAMCFSMRSRQSSLVMSLPFLFSNGFESLNMLGGSDALSPPRDCVSRQLRGHPNL